MANWYVGLVGIAAGVLVISALFLAFRAWDRRQLGAVSRKDAAPRRSSPEGDVTGDAVGAQPTLQARLDELDYRFAALKAAHEQLAESIGTRFATMGKRITRAGAPSAPSELEDDPSQSDFLTALSGGPSRSSSSASHNGARRLVPRSAPRR